ncbi:alpha-N-acetyl-neuraminyl-2,3-beta-galactosyl-1,3-N-acetyl-galactosaminide alpha-2,6-sialyltransferase-like [Anneissia japonica]|uniref:alpha-N-acetyl-neuraminyl-2,3-beta-galactosyl-1, 3-N-acetyl-galactosaminide alpha-2,6-sialyltransferase-like n=1 Tax=Anneissia japonica TaxID=1529436 RepID=UPI0014255E37|nr:alpha-N-acetyl-neuraminyl-2,3-beta-galactosyl-1,3-N-acetyl-galactosaminide alpha-2,6-sialyltransferase-like [Anneissia japonica]
MENKKILILILCYGFLMLCVWMFYTQRFVNSQWKIRSDIGSSNITNQILKQIHHPLDPVKDTETFIYTNKTLKITSNSTKKVVQPTVKPVPKISIRQYYSSLANSTTLDYNCSQCALVSSSGQLLGRGLGSVIDANECVIRMNNAPSQGFHKDVGNRTTIRLGSFNSVKAYTLQPHLFSGEASPDVVILWGLHQPKHVNILKAAQALPKLYKNTQFYAETLAGEDYAGKVFEVETGIKRLYSKTWLSTGWFTMLMALDICEKINLYGFIPEDHCKTHPGEIKRYHYYQSPNSSLVECKYYTSNEGRTGSGHRFVTEKAIFSRWAQRYNMTFHAPSWNITKSEFEKIDTPFVKNQSKAKKMHVIRKRIPPKRRHL